MKPTICRINSLDNKIFKGLLCFIWLGRQEKGIKFCLSCNLLFSFQKWFCAGRFFYTLQWTVMTLSSLCHKWFRSGWKWEENSAFCFSDCAVSIWTFFRGAGYLFLFIATKHQILRLDKIFNLFHFLVSSSQEKRGEWLKYEFFTFHITDWKAHLRQGLHSH